jgi:hypothetical protein
LHTAETGERTTLWEKVSIVASFVVGLFETPLLGFKGRHALAAFPEVFKISFGNFARPPRRPALSFDEGGVPPIFRNFHSSGEATGRLVDCLFAAEGDSCALQP